LIWISIRFVANFVERCKNEGTELTANVNVVDMQLSEYSVTTGFTGTPCLLGGLAENGEFYTAYRMLENEEFASWLYPVKLGATSIWERWNTFTEYGPNSQTMNSFNHYAFGVSAAFMITNSAGIQRGDNGDLHRAGFSDFVLQPVPGGSFEFVNCTYKSVNGLIESSWTADPAVVNEVSGVSDLKTYSAVVPANSTATLYLPLGSTITEEAVNGFAGATGVNSQASPPATTFL
jgi:alpha-L-rhamnosidase